MRNNETTTTSNYGNSNYTIIRWEDADRFFASFKKTGTKTEYIDYCFTTHEKREEYIAKIVVNILRNYEFKKQRQLDRKAQALKVSNNLKVGDIFVNSWGYEQTNIDAYQVVEKNGMNVKIRKIATKIVDQVSDMAEHRQPVKDVFVSDEILDKRVSAYGISFTFGCASLWNGKDTFYRSHYA